MVTDARVNESEIETFLRIPCDAPSLHKAGREKESRRAVTTRQVEKESSIIRGDEWLNMWGNMKEMNHWRY